jgi:K+-transporting ATPase ATPase C chain
MTALRISVVFFILCGGIYPAVVTLIGHGLFPEQAQGSIIYDNNGKPIGSRLIAQAFDRGIYFQPRPSAAGPDGYDPTSTGGSNLGPTNPALVKQVQSAVQTVREKNPGLAVVPADLVESSASGLDPDISPQGAMAQVPRVAKARGVTANRITALVESHVQERDFGIFGEPRVNVLELNLALDQQFPVPA